MSRDLLQALAGEVHEVAWRKGLVDAASDEDVQLALYCCYELHYQGLPGVDEEWEWEPSVLKLRKDLERRFEAELRQALGPLKTDPRHVAADLWRLARSDNSPSLSRWVYENGTVEHARELAIHRSLYQLKEADPHTWAIPRLTGAAKSTMVAIQSDEYGAGVAGDMHSSLFAVTMDELGLDSTYGAYLNWVPAVTLATTNLISMFGLHRRHRGALAGHLALFEMTSVTPMGRYAMWMERLGTSQMCRRFYEVHVEADELHQHLALDKMIGSLIASEPHLAPSVLFGAHALALVESRFSAHIMSAWQAGETSLTDPQRRRAQPAA